MRHAIGIRQDDSIENPPMYVTYAQGAEFGCTKAIDPEGDVLVDYDTQGGIIGIELLYVAEETIGWARQVAQANDLVLPDLERVFA